MNVQGTTVTGTLLSATEFCDLLCARYDVTPPNLQNNCNWCGIAFDVCHSLSCRKGGLVIVYHKKLYDKLFYLAQLAFTSASLNVKLPIHWVSTIPERDIFLGSDKDKEMWGGTMIRGLWGQKSEAIINVKLGNADMDSYKFDPMATLQAWL